MAREEKQSCPEKLVAIRRGESNRRGPLPPLEVAGSRQGGPEQPWGAGWPPEGGRAVWYPLHLGGGWKPYKERSQVLPDSFPLPLDPLKGNGVKFLLLVCVWPGRARTTTTPFHFLV